MLEHRTLNNTEGLLMKPLLKNATKRQISQLFHAILRGEWERDKRSKCSPPSSEAVEDVVFWFSLARGAASASRLVILLYYSRFCVVAQSLLNIAMMPICLHAQFNTK